MSAESVLAGIKANTVSMPREMVAQLVAQGASPEELREAWGDYNAGFQSAATAARTAERQRCKAILSLPEAKDRASMAKHLALETDLSPDTAARLLATAPTESAPTARPNRLDLFLAEAANAAEPSADAVARRVANY